jgi:sterol 3beta-glucosyltransferase
LAGFLAAGPPPVYIGFGSIVIDSPDAMTEKILEAVKAANVRAIVSKGWSKLGGNMKSTDSVFFLGDCPHGMCSFAYLKLRKMLNEAEWLFQHVAAVVHHGGAGTTACGLLNGQPTVIVPFFGE